MEIALLTFLAGLAVGYGLSRCNPARAATTDNASAAETLKREARDLGTILGALNVPTSKRDGAQNVTFCNVAFCEIAEDQSEDAMSVAELELFPGQRALAKKALETGEAQHVRRHIVVGGKRLLFDIHEIPFASENISVGFAQNISELEDAHEEIQRHISAQRDLLESSTAAMAIYGRDGRLKYYNVAFTNLWKLEDPWLATEPHYADVLEHLRDKRKLPEQANFLSFKQAQLKLFTTLIEPDESFYYLPDGKILRAVAIPHALGGILFVYEDVTDRVALERSYNTLIAVQRETLDNLHEAVAVFGEDGRLRLCNPMFHTIWKLSPDFTITEPHMREWLELSRGLFATDNWEQFAANLTAKLQQRQFTAMRFDRADSSVIDCASVPLPDGATLITFIDVTDSTLLERSLREKNEALETADRVKTEFLANMSYELRSPLTSISGFAEMLSKSYIGPLNATQAEYVGHIYESSQHLSTLISAIIDLATIEAGYMQLHLAPCDLAVAADQVCALSAQSVKSRGLDLVHSTAAPLPVIHGDEMRIKQMLMQLVSTAARYGKPGTDLLVHTDLLQGQPTITLIATTRTPAAALVDTINGSRNTGNAELGLTMVARLMALHGGTLTATCEDAHRISITLRFVTEFPAG